MMGEAATRWALGGAVLATYAVLSFGLGDVYPLSRFEFFGFSTPEDSRVVARHADGAVREVFASHVWECDDGLDLSTHRPDADERCGRAIQDPVRDGQVLRWILQHPPASDPPMHPVELVRQVIRYDRDTGAETISWCAIATCRAGL